MSTSKTLNKTAATLKLNIQLVLTTIFFFVELTVGYLINSIALMADALHMLNDVFSLAIAIYCNKLKLNSKKTLVLTYGFQRAEVLGALMNSVLLVGLCITILLEAVPRLFNPIPISDPFLLLIVGVVGLLFNVFGMFLFGHNHSHGSHNHGHTDHHPQHQTNVLQPQNEISEDSVLSNTALFQQRIIEEGQNLRRENYSSRDNNSSAEDALLRRNNKNTQNNHHHQHHHENINMKGIYLHVLGDALANVGVIITSLVIMWSQNKAKYLVDPITSILITLLIMKLTIPLIKNASLILLQTVPTNISLQNIRSRVLEVEGVYGVHELHVWHLADNKVVGSCHVTLDKQCDYMKIAGEIKEMFHSFGIHSVTVQPEYVEKNLFGLIVNKNCTEQAIVLEDGVEANTQCILNCNTTECNEAQCCPTPT